MSLSRHEQVCLSGVSFERYFSFGPMMGEVSHLVHYDILLQNGTNIITKCDSYFITKCDRSLLKNVSGFLL